MKAAVLLLLVLFVAGCVTQPQRTVSPTHHETTTATHPTATHETATLVLTTSPAPTGTSPRHASGNATFVLVRDSYWINQTGSSNDNGYTFLDSPHCGDGGFTLSPDAVNLVRRGPEADLTVPSHVVAHAFANRTKVPFPALGASTGNRFPVNETTPGQVTLKSPFKSHPLLGFTFDGQGVTVNGTALVARTPVTRWATYDVQHTNQTYQIQHVLTIEWRGTAPVRIDGVDQYCI